MSIWANINKRSEGAVLRREEIIFRPMIYRNNRDNPEIIARNIYKGVQYVVINIGPHPCAYVTCPESFINKHKTEYGELDCDISVHGGVTYVGNIENIKGCKGMKDFCFGWDYGHHMDWDGMRAEEYNILYGQLKYTTEMVVEDCKDAIDQYLKILENDKQVKEITDDWEEVESLFESLDFDDIDDL